MKKIFLLLILPVCVFARLATDFTFFDRSVQRRYYPHEFYSKIVPQSNPFVYSKLSPYFYSYRASSYLSAAKAVLTKDDLFSGEVKRFNEEIIYLSYLRNNMQKGAFELSTKIELPSWGKTLSLWILDNESGNEAALYIKTKQGRKKYSLGVLNHQGWKNFILPLENYSQQEKVLLERIKFFNRKKKGGANELKVVLKLGLLEVFSHSIQKRDLGDYYKEFNGVDFLSQDPKEKLETDILTPNLKQPSFYRLKKGSLWTGNEFLSLFVSVGQPVSLEIYGSLLPNRKKLFVLQLPIISEKGKLRIDVRYPAELVKSHMQLEKEGVIFWGIGIFPASAGDSKVAIDKFMLWSR